MALRPRIDRAVVKVPPREPDRRDENHRKAVKRLPCLSCGGTREIDPHHLVRGLPEKERGMSRKAADRYLVPMCRRCHTEIHGAKWGSDDEAYLIARGVDGRSIADALYRVRGDEDALRRIVERSLLSRGVYVG